MAWKHVKPLLSAYIQDELDAPTREQVKHHLLRCKKCQAVYERIKLGSQLAARHPKIQTPDNVWQGIRGQLDRTNTAPKVEEKQARSRRLLPRLSYGLAAAATMLIVWWTIANREPTQPLVDLDPYLRSIEGSANSAAIDFASSALLEFDPADRLRACKAAGIDHVLAQDPLPDFVLIDQRVRIVAHQQAVQLVYSDKKEVFAVFVSPESIDFSFDSRAMQPTQVEEVRCSRVASPAVAVFWFGAGGFHCVLVSPFEDPEKNASVIRYFVEAHDLLKKKI